MTSRIPRVAEVQPGSAAGAAPTDWRAIMLLSLGFGLVGMDRFMISTLFPVIAMDLHLGYGDIGIITGALSISWGLAALVMGNKADRIGRRAVIIGALVAFSLMIGASGLATGLLGLVLVRIVMGVADGSYIPSCIAATFECAEPRHFGRASGFQQMMSALFGLGVAPLMIAGLLQLVEWRYIFAFVAVPGLLLAWLIARWLPRAIEERPVNNGSFADWRCVLGYRNVRLAMVLMLCFLTCLITTSAFMPSYLLEHRHLGFTQMSVVMSAIGIGSGIGTLTLLSASDRFGRRIVTIAAALVGMVALVLFMVAPSNATILFALLFVVHFCNSAAIALVVGPIAAEAVPAALVATASGVVICIGELIGGGLLPIIAGRLIESYGIAHFLMLPIAALVVASATSAFLVETRLIASSDRAGAI